MNNDQSPPRRAARLSSTIGVYSAAVQERAIGAHRDHATLQRALSTPEFEHDLEQALQAAFGKR